MESLAELIPSIYSQSDSDGSLAKFIQVYDQTHAEQLAVVESLQTVRIPNFAPLAFLPDIATSLGNPFPFMTADRWKRGNKLNALPFIYSLRGSQQGIQDTIRYLTGVSVVVEMDVQYCWILGQRLLSGSSELNLDYVVAFIDQVKPNEYWSLTIVDGARELTQIPYSAIASPNLLLRDVVTGQCFSIAITDGALTMERVADTEDAKSVHPVKDSTTNVQRGITSVSGTLTIS